MAFQLNNIKTNEPITTTQKNKWDGILKKEINWFGNGFGNKKKQYFYQELGVLLKAGVTIKDALILLVDSTKKNNEKLRIEQILKSIIGGNSFADALKNTQIFTEYEYYSINIGEETGTTAQVCQELGNYFARKNEQKRIIISALTYPAIVVSTAILVVLFMLTYVVPMFEDIFKQNKMELPLLTRWIVTLANFVQEAGIYCILTSIAMICSYQFVKDNPLFKKGLHQLILKTPILGNFISKVYLAQFTQAVSLLTTSKIPMLNSIQLVKKMIQFIPLQNALDKVENEILKGNCLSASLKTSPFFDNRILALVKVAEETNQTEYVFNQLNEQYNQEVITQSKLMSTILEPFIILFVGIIVAILLIAMYLPMFQLSSVIG